MARIQKYTASVPQQVAQAPTVNIQDPVGAALEGLGGQISNVAEFMQQRAEQKENFKTEDAYRRLQLNLGEQLTQRAENMADDGEGFHDQFVNEVYNPARDEFLASVPERLRSRYQTLLGDEGSDAAKWSISAAERERDQTYKWYGQQLDIGQEQLANAISLDPDAYDDLYKQGLAEIDAAGLPTSIKAQRRQAWERMAQIAHLNRMLETRPQEVLKELGADPRYLTPTSQFGIIKNALIQQETGGEADPDTAVSKAGAIGLMQVMPETAREISKALGDGLITKNMNGDAIREVLSNREVNERYGDYYLRKQIKSFASKGGLEAALIAYNGGPARAKEWIESGFDDSVLPAETRNYYKEIMKRLPGLGSGAGAPKEGTGRAAKFNPQNVTLEFKQQPGLGKLVQGDQEKDVNPDLVNRVKTSFAGLGIDRVKINSGYRSATKNAAVGGARNSQHIHGNAMDIDVSGYSIEERKKLIQSLSANGITGLGIGNNIIHADMGNRRAWGYANSAGGGAVPKWAQGVIADHLANRSSTPGGTVRMAGRYASLPYSDRQNFIKQADQSITKMLAEQNKATAVQKYELKTAIRNDLSSIERTGQSTGAVDDSTISSVLGEDEYVKFINDRDVAMRMYTGKDGIGEMTIGEMEDRLNEYSPDPGSPTFADDQKVHAAIQKEIDRITRLRASKPDEAAMLFPDVKEKWDAIKDEENPAPEAVQEFVRVNLEKQQEFGLKPGSQQPVPRAWAMEIGRSLSRIPEIKGKNLADVNAAILIQYDALQKVFGEYTDEVIINALQQYKGVGKNTAELITGYMQAIQAGGDPLARIRQKQSAALDRDQVESVSNEPSTWNLVGRVLSPVFWPTTSDSDAPPDDAGQPEPEGVNQESVLRAMNAINNMGGDLTAEDEAQLRTRYGDKVMNAALAKTRSGE